MRKRDFLIKVNKPPRCHNPFSHCLLFAANSSGRSYFNSLAFLLYTLLWSRFSKPNLLDFVGMKRSRTEKSPWIKSKAKPGPKKKKIDEFHPESEADGASSLDVPGLGVSRKKIMAVKKGEEQNSVTGEPLPGTSQDYSSSSDSENVEEEACGETWTIVDRKVLEKSVICRFCESESVNFEEVTSTGLGAEWVCRCKNSNCASHQTLAPFHTTPKTNRFYDINRELVLGLRLIGRGYSAATKVLGVLNLPRPVSNVSWTAHTKAIELAANELLERELQNAVLQVKRYKLENGDLDAKVDSSIADEQLKDIFVDAGVSIDGSWNSRGWSARDGMVAVVSIDTGKVLDVVFLSNSCAACEQKKREQREGKISKRDFLGWFIGHEENCYLNHEGSSQVCILLFI